MTADTLPLGIKWRACGIWLVAWLAANVVAWAAAGAVILPEGSNPRQYSDGELLLGELNCDACHAFSTSVSNRVRSRQAPILEGIGARVTPAFLRRYLTDPAAQKHGTTMPDMLAGLEPGRKRGVVEALTHYLVSQQGPAAPGVRVDDGEIMRGDALYHQIGCIACHAPRAGTAHAGGNPSGAPAVAVETETSSVPLGDLARKYSVGQLAAFLSNPLQYWPAGRMPDMKLAPDEARAVAMFLLKEQVAVKTGQAPAWVQGVEYACYEGEVRDDGSNIESLRLAAKGAADHFDISHRTRNDNIGMVFTGSINLPAEGDYKFATTSDDGSRLSIDGHLVVNNDGTHPAETKSGSARLTAGRHSIRVTYFNGGGELELKILVEGPGLARREIGADMLSHNDVPMRPLDDEALTPDPGKVEEGSKYFTMYGCSSCHALGSSKPTPPAGAKELAALNVDSPTGCLSQASAGGAAKYDLSEAQREALRSVVRNRARLDAALSAAEKVERDLVVFECYTCHPRAGVGGPISGRADYFTVVGGADLGDEGRIPPHLTRAGYKLRREWIQEVLWNRASVRPYMATRMPQYGAANLADLPAELALADQAGDATDFPGTSDPAAKKAGRKLVGNEGLSCISCHVFAGHASLGIPAIDLVWMTKRLNPRWFRDYLLDPQTLRPGTRMPSFWPDHKSAKPDILGGDTEAQVAAVWAFLADGVEARLPEGLTVASMEIVAEKEAVIYRNFIEGAGSRAIGVGYPEKADLAFDANNMALAMVWHGRFIDASRHRSGRGEGYQPPLGEDVVKLDGFPPFAELKDGQEPWPHEGGKNAGYKMHGYILDEKRRPKFLYDYRDMRIEDYPQAVRVNDEPVLRREIRVESGQSHPGLYFLAARAGQIVRRDDGSYVLDGKAALKLESGGAAPVVRKIDGGFELLVPVPFLGNQAVIKEEFSW